MSSLDYYRPPHDLLDDRKRRLDKDAYDDDRNVKSRYLYREGGRRYSNGRSGSRDSDEYRLKHDFSRGYGSHKKVDPYTSNYLVPFTIFNEWYKSTNTSMDIEDNEMYQKYEAYKQDLYARLAKPFVYKHMDEPWFREKYQPDSRSPIYKKILETKKAARIVFLQCLRERAFDKFTMDDDDGPESERGSVPIENVIHIFEESFDDNLKTNKEVLSIKNITPNVSYADITSLLSGHSIVKNIILSGPNPFRGFMREGFVELNDTNGVENLIQTIQSQKPNEKAGPITVVFYSSPSFSKKILLPPLSNTFENLSKDLEFAIQAVKKLDAKMDKNFDFTEEVKDYLGLSTFDFQEDSNDGHNMMKKILDLLIEYLRQVHFFHFYTVTEYDSRYELEKMFPGRVVRSSTNQSDDSLLCFKQELWRTNFVEKMNIFLDLENADLLKLGGKPIDEAVELKIESHVKKEDEKRFRCSVNGCKKLFKGPEFVKKHIEKRHSEWLNEAKKEFILLNNYVLDTSRVFPIEAYSYSDIVNQRGTLKNDSDVSPKSITQLPASGSFHFCPPSEKININYDQDINFKKSLSGKSLYNKPKVFNEHKGKSDGKMLRVYKDLDRVIDETPDLNY